MEIILDNNRSKIIGDPGVILRLREHPLFAIRAPGAYYTNAYRKKQWDGKVRYITPTGFIDTGKLPQAIKVLESEGMVDISDMEVLDNRYPIEPGIIPKNINGVKVRPYQYKAVRAVVKNELYGIPFPRGIIDAATNAGKTIIAAMLFLTYDTKTAFILNSKELFNQAIEDLSKLIPGRVGWLSSERGYEPNDLMVIMAPTVYARAKNISLSEYRVVLVDECDLAGSKTYKVALSKLYNAYVKIGMSGSIDKHRDKNQNEKVRCHFGNTIYKISNKELIDHGYSSDVKVYFIPGGHNHTNYYEEALESGIIFNTKRNKNIISRIRYHVRRERLPILILTRLHEHVKLLYGMLLKEWNIMGNELFGLKVDWVHGERKDRHDVVRKFKKGDIDILVGSYILKRGKNFPLMKALIHAAGGRSAATVIQVLGRATRKHESKEYTVIDDFWDTGKYLETHSRKRFRTYAQENIKVIRK